MGERFRAAIAVLLIHSFGGAGDDKGRDDYQRFAEAMRCALSGDTLMLAPRTTRLPLLLGWAPDKPATPEQVARAM